MDLVRPVASRAVLLLVIAGLVMTSCGESNGANPAGPSAGVGSGGGNPASPSGGGGSAGGSGSGTCRTYPTAATVTMTRGALTQTPQLTGSFNSSANTATVTVAFTSDAMCSTEVSTYQSTADFVDEVRVIPGLTMQTSTTTTFSGGCDSGTSTVNHVYDSQRRLVSSTTSGVTTTYTAWDSAGRPTAGSFPGTTIANTYNDSTRTWVQTQTRGAASSTTTVTYDANGAQTSVVYTAGGITTTTTFNTTATAQVCK